MSRVISHNPNDPPAWIPGGHVKGSDKPGTHPDEVVLPAADKDDPRKYRAAKAKAEQLGVPLKIGV